MVDVARYSDFFSSSVCYMQFSLMNSYLQFSFWTDLNASSYTDFFSRRKKNCPKSAHFLVHIHDFSSKHFLVYILYTWILSTHFLVHVHFDYRNLLILQHVFLRHRITSPSLELCRVNFCHISIFLQGNILLELLESWMLELIQIGI
jgi:hypothetical protein